MGAHGTRPPQPAEDEDVDYTFIVNANDDLQTPAEAQACPGWPDWHTAVDRKVEPLKHLGTYELVQCPLDCKPIGCKWVFRLKCNATGAAVKYKAQLVAQGFAQKLASIMSKHSHPLYGSRHCAPSLPLDLDIHVIDVVSAYLNGELQEEIYMQQPPMYEMGSLPPAACTTRSTGSSSRDASGTSSSTPHLWPSASHASSRTSACTATLPPTTSRSLLSMWKT